MAEDLNAQLRAALGKDNLDEIRSLLDRGANPNAPPNPEADENSPLAHYGIESQLLNRDPNIEVVRLLLERGANPNGNPEERSPLMQYLGYPPIVQLLLERGADPDNGGANADTPLHNAAGLGSPEGLETIRMLLERNANPNIPSTSEDKATPLDIAVEVGFLPAVELLLDRGANVNGIPGENPPLVSAMVEGGDISMLRLLFQRGANPNAKDKKGTPIIHMAQLPVVIAEFRAAGADMNARNANGDTALTNILKKRRPYVTNAVRALLEQGADPNLANTAGQLPLSIALSKDNLVAAFHLLEGGANPRDLMGSDGSHIIFNMVDRWGEELDSGGDDTDIRLYARIVVEMIRRGIDPNIRGNDNDTLLHYAIPYAIFDEAMDLIDELVGLGVDPNAAADEGMTPLERAAFLGFNNADRLIAAGFNPNFRNTDDGTTLLHRIANRPFGPGHETDRTLARAIKHALKYPGIDVNIRNARGETPLHVAARRNNVLVVRALVEGGADKNLRVEGDGAETPLAIDLATDESVKAELRGYTGKTRESIALFDRVFENPADISLCPVCLAFSDRESGCRYMKHICKPEERDETLFRRFRGTAVPHVDKIEWCTECGRICNTYHQHYNVAPYTMARPGLAPVDPARGAQGIAHFLPDCRPSGGGGLEEKFLRFYHLIQEFAKLEAEGDRITQQAAKRRAVLAAWNGPSDEGRTVEEQGIRQNLRNLAELLRNPPAAGAPPPEVDAWNARVLSLKTFGINPEVFPPDRAPVVEPPVPDFPRPEADRDLLPIQVPRPPVPPGGAAAGPVGTYCLAEAGPHDDGRPTFRLRHRQPDGRIHEHPVEEAICGEDLVTLINSGVFTGKCPINTDVCKADLHPDELDAFGDQITEDARQNYRSKYNRLKAGQLLMGGRRKTYRKKSRRATGRRQRGGKLDANKMFRRLGDDEYECAIGAF